MSIIWRIGHLKRWSSMSTSFANGRVDRGWSDSRWSDSRWSDSRWSDKTKTISRLICFASYRVFKKKVPTFVLFISRLLKHKSSSVHFSVTCSFAYTCAELLSVLKLYFLASSLLRAVVTTHTCNFRQTQIIFRLLFSTMIPSKGCVKSI